MKCANPDCARDIVLSNNPRRLKHGHNGTPLVDGRVCSFCNELVRVLRIMALRDRERNTTEHPDYLKPLVDCERFGAKKGPWYEGETDKEVGT